MYYKTYPRLPKIDLPQPEVLNQAIGSVLKARTSKRNFWGDVQGLTKQEIATLLGLGAGKVKTNDNVPFRTYPSAGGLYPLELYLWLMKSSGDILPGLYHYNVKGHYLESLSDDTFVDSAEALLSFESWVGGAACSVFTTSVFSRVQAKYGEQGYRFCLLEAGAVNQSLVLLAEALSLKSCNVGMTKRAHEYMETLLDIDGYDESLVNMLVLGR